MANTTITIELRQADAKVNSNGDYENQLARQVTIEDGDIVMLKSCFLDTVNQQNINVYDDLTLTLVNGVYITDWYYSDDYKETWTSKTGAFPDSNTVSPSGNNYIAYKAVGIPTTGFSLVNYFAFNISPQADSTLSNFPVTFSYRDTTNTLSFFQSSISWVNWTGTDLPQNPKYQVWVPVNVIAKDGTFTALNQPLLALEGLTVIGPNTSPVSEDETYQPWLFTTNITLPKGSYTTAEISTLISKELSKNGTISNANMVNSNFLFESGSFDAGKPNPDGTPGNIAVQTPFISSNIVDSDLVDGTLFKFVPDKKMFVGASQLALEFNSDNNKFNFTYLHTPMYDATNGDTISVRYINQFLNPANELIGVTTNGGVFFTSMYATDSQGNYVDFWGGSLGFDVGSMCVNLTQPITNIFGDTTSKYYLVENLVPGQHITTGYIGLDTAVVKGANSWYIGQVPKTDTPADLQNGISSTLNDTVGIVAPENYTLLIDSFSHYLLQLDINFYNTFIGVDNWRNLNAIVNKYYNYGSYTFGDPDSALTYTHKGAPLTIKSIKTRVLTPDKKLDESLGADNTIYLSVIKPLQSMPVQ